MKKYNRIGLVSAMEQELEYLDEYLTSKPEWRKYDDNEYYNNSSDIHLYSQVIGAGKVNAAYQSALHIERKGLDLLINVGFAGGIGDNLEYGDIIIGTEYDQVDFIPLNDTGQLGNLVTPSELSYRLKSLADLLGFRNERGRIVTGDFFLHDSETRCSIKDRYAPLAFDMESAAISQVAAGMNVDFESVRVLSDLADESAQNAFKDGRSVSRGEAVPIEHRPIILVEEFLRKI